MLKLPKGLKKKKKGKKSKRKGEEELFTEEELQKYRKEHQQQNLESGEVKENEEWSKFNNLTTGVDSILKKTQGDLDRIKSTSFFQRIPAGPKQVDSVGKEIPQKPQVKPVIYATEIPEVSKPESSETVDEFDKSDYAITDTESEEDDVDDIFDTSYVEAVERGEVKLTYVPDSPDDFKDDDLFDTSHVDAIIKGQETKTTKGKKTLDIGVAVEVLTGRIDNVTIRTKKSKRVIPGDLLLESTDQETAVATNVDVYKVQQSILDEDADIPITSPIDLSKSLHTSLIQKHKESLETEFNKTTVTNTEDEVDEFTLLAAESLESSDTTKLNKEIREVKPVLQESWSAFEANANESVFAESIVEDQIEVDPFINEVDPFDTSFADCVVSATELKKAIKDVDILDDDDDFDPRADEIKYNLNNRRKSSVRIHLTDPAGIRESITSDDIYVREENLPAHDLLSGSNTDLSQLGHSPIIPVEIVETEIIDPFDTSLVDKIVAPGKIELKLLEQELIHTKPIHRVDSDPDFDPRADEINTGERRFSRPENLSVSKSVVFNVEKSNEINSDTKVKTNKPLTPYYTKELSISEDYDEEGESSDIVNDILPRTRSTEDLSVKLNFNSKRRHSEYTQSSQKKLNVKVDDLLVEDQSEFLTKVLTPSVPDTVSEEIRDPFDTTFATNIPPGKTELKLLAKEFSCDEQASKVHPNEPLDLLDPSDDIFQAKALSPEPSESRKSIDEDIDPFDTSFACNLQPGRSELKRLESELLN